MVWCRLFAVSQAVVALFALQTLPDTVARCIKDVETLSINNVYLLFLTNGFLLSLLTLYAGKLTVQHNVKTSDRSLEAAVLVWSVVLPNVVTPSLPFAICFLVSWLNSRTAK